MKTTTKKHRILLKNEAMKLFAQFSVLVIVLLALLGTVLLPSVEGRQAVTIYDKLITKKVTQIGDTPGPVWVR